MTSNEVTEETETIETALKEVNLSEDKDDEEAVHEEETRELEEDEPEEEEEEEEETSIYDDATPNRIIVGRNFPLSFYVDRARRILRIDSEVYVDGRGENIATACKLVESLKRQKVAQTIKISTGMNTEPYFTAQGDARWGPPSAVISFKLSRGEFAQYIADYQQRKIVEIFEDNDEKAEGVLSLDKIESMELDSKFQANDDQIAEAQAFLSNLSEASVDLPTFIKYASICIHPLMKNVVFKQILSKEFGLSVTKMTSKEEEPKVDDQE